jgi:hypothetical protein
MQGVNRRSRATPRKSRRWNPDDSGLPSIVTRASALRSHHFLPAGRFVPFDRTMLVVPTADDLQTFLRSCDADGEL